MEDLLGFLFIFVVFVLGPLIEQLRKKNQQPPPPQQRPEPRPLPPQQRSPDPRSRTETFEAKPEYTQPYGTTTRTQDAQTDATSMVPDELWEILTGQPKPRPQGQQLPAPRREPVPFEAELEADEDLEEAQLEDVYVETRRSREEAVSLETMPRREAPIVVSMETMPDPRARHAAFHAKVAAPAVVAPVKRVPVASWLDDPAEVRRAIILQAVLGPPRGLESDPFSR